MIPYRETPQEAQKQEQLSFAAALEKATGEAWEPVSHHYTLFHKKYSVAKSCCAVVDADQPHLSRPQYYMPVNRDFVHHPSRFYQDHIEGKLDQALDNMPWIQADLDSGFPEFVTSGTSRLGRYAYTVKFTLSGDIKVRKIGSKNSQAFGTSNLKNIKDKLLITYFENKIFTANKVDINPITYKLNIGASAGFDGSVISIKIAATPHEPNTFEITAEMTNPQRINTIFEGFEIKGEFAFTLIGRITSKHNDNGFLPSKSPLTITLPSPKNIDSAIALTLDSLGLGGEISFGTKVPTAAVFVFPISLKVLLEYIGENALISAEYLAR